MPVTIRNTLKSWFSTAQKPLGTQFASAWDSFWHKTEDTIPITSIENLQATLATKIDIALLNAEAATRYSADQALQAEIDTNATAITTEATTRAAADAALQTSINTNTTNIATNATAIAAEATTRAAADAALQTAVNTNTTNIATNATAIATEATTRAAADAALQTAVNTNTTDIATNATAIAAEATTRAAADAALQTAVNTNTTNIATNATAIATEATTRAAADAALQTAVNTNTTDIATNATAIATEATARAAADALKADKSITLTINGTTYDLSANRAWTLQTLATTGSIATMLAVVSPVAGQQFWCTDCLPGLWIYNTIAGAWRFQPSPMDVLFAQKFPFQASGSAFQFFQKSVAGSGAAISVISDGATKYGAIATSDTGTTTTGVASIVSGVGHFMLSSSSKVAVYHQRMKVNALSTSTDEFFVNLGNGDSSSNISTATFSYNRANNAVPANWYATCGTNYTPSSNSGASVTTTDTGVAVDTNYHDFIILVDVAAATVKFYIDWVLKATITTNIPTTSNRLFSGCIIKKSAGTNSRLISSEEINIYVFKA